MKKLIVLGAFSLIGMTFFLRCSSSTPSSNPSGDSTPVDTSKYTDVILKNWSESDVDVYVTLQAGETIVGLFGMDSSNIDTVVGLCPYIVKGDTLYSPCHGKFSLKKGGKVHLGSTKPVTGAIVTFGARNSQCSASQKNGWKNGVNNFEFTVNTWWVDGKVVGSNESFDITLVDGLHSLLQQSVTSFGPRVDTIALPTNFGAYWDYGLKDDKGNLYKFTSSRNGSTFKSNSNIPGVYPYGCDMCYESLNPPTPICFSIFPSNEYGKTNICQTNRPGQGGQVICEYFGLIGKPQPALK